MKKFLFISLLVLASSSLHLPALYAQGVDGNKADYKILKKLVGRWRGVLGGDTLTVIFGPPRDIHFAKGPIDTTLVQVPGWYKYITNGNIVFNFLDRVGSFTKTYTTLHVFFKKTSIIATHIKGHPDNIFSVSLDTPHRYVGVEGTFKLLPGQPNKAILKLRNTETTIIGPNKKNDLPKITITTWKMRRIKK